MGFSTLFNEADTVQTLGLEAIFLHTYAPGEKGKTVSTELGYWETSATIEGLEGGCFPGYQFC